MAKNRHNRKLLAFAMLVVASESVQAEVNPMDLNALIGQAVLTHPLVGSAVAEERAAAEGVTAAKLGLLPTPSITTGDDIDNGLVSQARIRQPIWTGGQLTANINQAIYDNKAATAYIFEQQNTVAKNTIDIWQSYIYAVALQDLYLENLERLKEFEQMMQRRVEQGVSARIELDLVTNRILQDQNALQGAIEQQRIAEARLAQMVGDQVSARSGQVPIHLLVQYAKEQSRGFGELAFSDVSQKNPSVVRQQYQVEAARQEVKAQRASRYPSLYVQYEHTYYHDRDRDNQKKDFTWGLSYDPGAGFSNIALARASEARVQSLIQNQEAARRTAMEDIQTQYQQFIGSRDKELSLTAAVAGAQIVTNSYRRQFIAGRKSWLEVLNAVREHSQYQQSLLEVQAQMVASFYKLQVDFGMMPWQAGSTLGEPVTEFRPYVALTDWLGSVNTDVFSKPTADEEYLLNGDGLVQEDVDYELIQNELIQNEPQTESVTDKLIEDKVYDNSIEDAFTEDTSIKATSVADLMDKSQQSVSKSGQSVAKDTTTAKLVSEEASSAMSQPVVQSVVTTSYKLAKTDEAKLAESINKVLPSANTESTTNEAATD